MRKLFSVIVLVLLVGWGCSSTEKQNKVLVTGTISVTDSSLVADLSELAVTIIKQDSTHIDTLFHTTSDSEGYFFGSATFPTKGRYPLTFSHNGEHLGQASIILADKDTLQINGQLPDLQRSFSVSSREHDAMQIYQRLNKNFQRVLKVVRSGQLRGDSLKQEFSKWSNLYWEVHKEKKGTLASELAASESIRLLEGLDNEKMMGRIRSVQEDDALVGLATTYGKNYLAHSEGLDVTLDYLDTLATVTEEKEMNMRIHMDRIKILYDSARVEEARTHLEEFQQKFSTNTSAKEWAKTVGYDINFLSPGDSIPDFSFSENGKIISRDSLLGSSYILEISKLANSLYQDQFDRTVVIHSIYKNYGLDIVTLPLDDSQITVDAFFEERVKAWPVADAQAYDRQELLTNFNIQLIPTRFLVDKEGTIVRKYIGREYQDVIKEIQTLINQEKEPAS